MIKRSNDRRFKDRQKINRKQEIVFKEMNIVKY